jgi:hypothetical protein
MTLRALIALALLVAGGQAGSVAPAVTREARFEIRTVTTTNGERTVLSSATVTGRSALSIHLRGEAGPFRMTARVVSRPDGDAIHVAARVETRREVGRSENDLPLVEEGAASQSATLAVDGSQTLAVFPFGRDAAEELSIEIVPRPALAASGVGPRIDITSAGPNGWMRIDADAVPAGFTVDAEIISDGRTVASGAGTAFPDERASIQLTGESAASLEILIDRYGPACAGAVNGFVFDLDGSGLAEPVRGWAGVAPSGAWTEYPLKGAPDGTVLRIRCTTSTGPS